MEEGSGLIANLATRIGASENALRLLLSLLTGYPLAFLYRSYVYGRAPSIQHAFFVICGLSLSYFNFGNSTIHSVLNILLNYVILVVAGGTSLSVYLAFFGNLVYLCAGYLSHMDETYQIRWTTAQCVLTLRLTGLVFDVFDGHKKVETLSSEQKETALPKVPSLLEMAAHTYFFGGFLVGPQFPLTRYQNLVKGAFSDPSTGGLPDSVRAGFLRLLAGALYTGLFQISSLFLGESDLTSQWFTDLPFLGKCLFILVWGKLMLYKYVGCWLITEGACIITGLTYNGKDKSGRALWDACANIHIIDYELACTGEELIGSFNVNTNRWMGKYVFKRLKFLGNKQISHAVTMLYLALWHGLVSGYIVNFALEFLIITCEKEVMILLTRAGVKYADFPLPLRLLCWILLKLYALFVLGYALVSFALFFYDKYGQVYLQTYFVVPVLFLSWPLWRKLLKTILPRHKAEINGNSGIKKED